MNPKDSPRKFSPNPNKSIEMEQIKNNTKQGKSSPEQLSPVSKNPDNPESDVIIGRFRKISSAKSMATNGNAKYTEFPTVDRPEGDDAEQGLVFKTIERDNSKPELRDKFEDASENVKMVPAANRAKITKSSFRNTEKPSRFKDNPSTTRFQMAAAEGGHTSDEHSGDDSDDPLTAHNDSYVQDTRYAKSFRHFTREALPRLDNYRNIMSIHAAYRPTLDELHNATLSSKPGTKSADQDKGLAGEGVLKFGWIQGVLVRCLLNIWGVMLFLRLSWVVGQAGIAQAMVLILTTTVVTTITALSMSAISTNGVIKGGGTYYMISRSLGPEFGGSIGLIFSMANAVACAMYVVGFCESMIDLLKSYGASIVDGGIQDARIIGAITIIILTFIVVVGMEWEAKAQQGLLVILLVAIVDFVIGTFVGPKTDLELAQGFIGYNMTLLEQNLVSDYRESDGVPHNFFSVFAIFFPAATGILAGANISGDLRDPQSSIPKGTLLAILLTTLSYLIMALMSGWTVAREATGDLVDLANGTFLNCTEKVCEYGLHHSFQVIELVSGFGPLIYAGCFAATLSSALASLVSAPKVFQALCKDKLYPGIVWFAKGYGKNNEPVRGYVLTFFIAICFILIGDLNTIAPLISNFFLAAYTLINFSTFHASLAKPVGWRPTFRFYNMWLSLFGAILCVAVMFLISWWTALLTLSVVLALYLIVSYRKPDVNWGSTTQAQTYKQALLSVQQLNSVTEHVKNYRPQILVLTGMPGARPPLVHFTYLLTKNLSLMLCGHIINGKINNKMRSALTSKSYQWFTKHKVKAFYSVVDDVTFEAGANALIQACGVGKLKPNILLMGFKSDWNKCPKDDLIEYVDVLHKALDVHMALVILRLQDGLNYSHVLEDMDKTIDLNSISKDLTSLSQTMAAHRESNESLVPGQNYTQMSQASSLSDMSTPASPSMPRSMAVSADPNADDTHGSNHKASNHNNVENSKHGSKMADVMNAVVGAVGGKSDSNNKERRWSQYRAADGSELPRSTLQTLTYFQRKHGANATIDVWWLYDDGGLTLLLPYIISTRRNWTSCKLRVFTLANKKAELEFEQRNMASLLAKFRIDYADLTLIPDITKKPQDSSISYFDRLIADFLVPENPDDPDSAPVTEADLLSVRDKTYRHLRLRELLMQHSMSSSLVVMTLPMPRKSLVPPQLYLSWLEVLTKDMPPFLLVRGNHTSVLTFYS